MFTENFLQCIEYESIFRRPAGDESNKIYLRKGVGGGHGPNRVPDRGWFLRALTHSQAYTTNLLG